MELLQVPDFAELGEVKRERQRTELGAFYIGKAKITVKINHEEQERLELSSKSRAYSDIAYCCELPTYASIPADPLSNANLKYLFPLVFVLAITKDFQDPSGIKSLCNEEKSQVAKSKQGKKLKALKICRSHAKDKMK